MKRFDPAAERDKGALAAALAPFLPASGLVLELGSGTGQTIAHLAGQAPWLRWQPSDREPGALASIAARRADAPSLLEPLHLDVAEVPWPVAAADAILAVRLLHHLDDLDRFLGEAARVLPRGAPLFLVGPLGAAGPRPVAAPYAALRGTAWSPATRVPARADVLAAAAGHGLMLEAEVDVAGTPMLVLCCHASTTKPLLL